MFIKIRILSLENDVLILFKFAISIMNFCLQSVRIGLNG
jgi:hypothetical protein